MEKKKLKLTVFMNRYNVELEEYSMYSVYSTSKSGVTGIVVIDFNDFGLYFCSI